MVFGLIGAGLQIAQTVKGFVDAGKAKKEAKAAEGGGAGGDGAPAKAAKGGDAPAAKAEPPKEQAIVERFTQMLNSPNVKSIQDIKGLRDQVMQALQQQGLKPEQIDSAMKKLNQAVIQKLGIGQPGPNGSMEVPLTPQNQQILQALGMKPDEVKNAGQPAQPGQPAPGAAAPAGAPLPGAQPPQAGQAPIPGDPRQAPVPM